MNNRQITEKIIRSFFNGNEKGFETYVAKDAVIQSPILPWLQKKENSYEMLKEVIMYWRHAFPNINSVHTSVQETPNSISYDWESEVKHTGKNFLGIDAKGKDAKYKGHTTYTFSKGKLIRYESQVDLDMIIAQLS